MPEIGEIKQGQEIGYSHPYYKYLWLACESCGKERWVHLVNGEPESSKCSKHGGQHTGYAENNINWKADTNNQQTGRHRAERWYPKQPCEICGFLGEHHHRDGNALNNEPSNIAFRCRKHHMEADGRLARLIENHKRTCLRGMSGRYERAR